MDVRLLEYPSRTPHLGSAEETEPLVNQLPLRAQRSAAGWVRVPVDTQKIHTVILATNAGNPFVGYYSCSWQVLMASDNHTS
jgi:hypothetical protein